MLLTSLWLFVAGLIGGFLAGLVGIGGGLVYIFFLPLALRQSGIPDFEIPQYTIANSVFAILFASASANFAMIQVQKFFIKEILIIGLMATVSSLLILHFIVNTHWYSMEVFNITIVILLLYMVYITIMSANRVVVVKNTEKRNWKLSLVGVASGSVAGLSGLGGGIVVVPVLNSLLKIDIKNACSISSGVIMISSLGMTLFNLFEKPLHDYHNNNLGYIIFPVALALSAGVLISSPMGVKAARKLSSQNISYIYATFLIIVMMKKVLELLLK